MTYEVGETVVYPHHGAARIIDIRQRKVRGEEKTYLQLEVAQGDLTILVSAESVELIGVRDVVDETGLEKVFEVLRAPLTEEPTNWSRLQGCEIVLRALCTADLTGFPFFGIEDFCRA